MASHAAHPRVCAICKREVPEEEYIIAYYYSPDETKRFCLSCAAPIVSFLKQNGLLVKE